MLNHFVIKTAPKGYAVAYHTPGCDVPTVACLCITESQASDERDRLNAEQAQREEMIQWERELRGLRRIVVGGIA